MIQSNDSYVGKACAISLLLSVLITFSGCMATSTSTSTETSTGSIDISVVLSKFDDGTGVSYEIKETEIIMTSKDLPNHKSCYYSSDNALYQDYAGTNNDFEQNPNSIIEQSLTFTIPRYPSQASSKTNTALGAIGVSINGVPFYNQYAGPDNKPLTSEINSFDTYNGHPQGQGQYHYHMDPYSLTATVGKSGFLGFLLDGFPVYGPEENSQSVTNSDLDDYHGHTHVTTEFTEGIYHYHITSEDPYINGGQFYGIAGSVTN